MPPPNLSPEQINQFSASVAEYIASQRDRFRERAKDLSPAQKSTLREFFHSDLLEGTRTLVLETERIANPPFYPALRSMRFSNLPDFAFMAAVTFRDVIVSHEPFSNGLLFHEFVHAEQYRQLGIPRFAMLYVRGFLTGGGYDGIPLEIAAYGLGARFESAPHVPFSVESEVSSWIKQGKL
jgi:hypothetical protein